MRISWQEQALVDLDETVAYISQDNPTAAFELVAEIFSSVENVLSDHPSAGRPGRVEGTREWVAHNHYIVAYRVQAECIQVLSVVHSARLWPNSF